MLQVKFVSFRAVGTIVMPAQAGIQVGYEEVKEASTGFPRPRE
jgi:hypothetical protein